MTTRLIILTAFVCLASSEPANAQTTYYWDANGAAASTGGTGNWDTSSSLWRIGSPTGALSSWPTTGDNTAFLGGAMGTLTIMTDISVNNITVAPSPSNPYTITGSSILNLSGTTQSVIDVAAGSSLAITSSLGGTSGLSKTNGGTLILDSAASSTTLVGNIAVSAGTLQAGSALNSSAAWVLRSNPVDLSASTNLTTVGTTAANSALSVGQLSGSGSVTPGLNGAINIHALGDSTFSGAVTTTGGLNLRGAGVQTFTGSLSGLSGAVAISGISVGSGNASTGLTISGNAGLTNASVSLALQGGGLTLDNTGGNTGTGSTTDRVLDTATITMKGGTLALLGNAANGSSETLGALTLNAGSANISVTHNGGSGGTVLTLASLARSNGVGATINFVGLGGTLGTANANPRIIFTTAPSITNSTLVTSTAPKVGFATVNGTDFAGYDATFGVVAVSTTSVSGALTSASTQNSLLSGSGTIAASAVSYNTLKINAGASATLNLTGTGSLSTTGILLTGSNDFTIQNTGVVTGGIGGGDDRYFYVSNANTTLNVAVSLAGSANNVIKSGDGFLALTKGTNQLGFASNKNVVIANGVLRGTATNLGGGGSNGGAFTTIQLRGGVLEISGGGTFSRALDLAGTSAGGGITWDEGGTERGNGGFSAINGNATITLVTTIGGSTVATPTSAGKTTIWGGGNFVADGYALLLGSSKADSILNLTNNIALDNPATNNPYFAREVRVFDNTNPLVTTDRAVLSGVIIGSVNADLLKTGPGVLELAGNNSYKGNTLVNGGTLLATNSFFSTGDGTGRVFVNNTGTFGGDGTTLSEIIVQNGGTIRAGTLAGVGTLTMSGRGLTINSGGTLAVRITAAGTTDATKMGLSSNGSNNNLLASVGAFSFDPAAKITLDGTGSTFTIGQAYSYKIATGAGDTSGLNIIDQTRLSTIGFNANSFSLTGDAGGDVFVNFTAAPVPEPTTILGIAVMALAFVQSVRRLRKPTEPTSAA
ncbi:MAG: autotransporter-associated beta strand repeat-containing protein [Planctomycetes bacterium]|nr:autotransporter-associated beta strand repeat-containing protein [Planctomycetota bacterium]